MPDLPDVEKKKPPTGPDRRRLATDLGRRYDRGATLRDLVADTGHSYGFVRNLVIESGVRLRGRGGPNRKART